MVDRGTAEAEQLRCRFGPVSTIGGSEPANAIAMESTPHAHSAPAQVGQYLFDTVALLSALSIKAKLVELVVGSAIMTIICTAVVLFYIRNEQEAQIHRGTFWRSGASCGLPAWAE